jgi:DNA-binding transcriptional regulator YiaG
LPNGYLVLQKDIRKYGRQIDKHKAPGVQATDTIALPDDFKITATQLKTLRGRLGINQKQLATIIGASVQSVALWETKPGRIQIRNSGVRGKLVELKGMKRAEVFEKHGIENPARKRKKRMDGCRLKLMHL